MASLAASIVGLGFMMFGDAQVGGFISTAAGVVASGFGVAYNPLAQRMTVTNFRARDSTSRPKLNLGWKKIPAFG